MFNVSLYSTGSVCAHVRVVCAHASVDGACAPMLFFFCVYAFVVCVCACVCVCVCVCMCACVCACVCTCVYMCVCECASCVKYLSRLVASNQHIIGAFNHDQHNGLFAGVCVCVCV